MIHAGLPSVLPAAIGLQRFAGVCRSEHAHAGRLHAMHERHTVQRRLLSSQQWACRTAGSGLVQGCDVAGLWWYWGMCLTFTASAMSGLEEGFVRTDQACIRIRAA